MKNIHIVGILNTTPDSYWDGGEYVSVKSAVQRAGEMIDEGVDIIEVGGESTGPGSKEVVVEEELKRTVPIIKAIRDTYPEALLGIDTYKAAVAAEAIKAGATMVNDVTAGRADPALFDVVARSNVKLVLMYAKDATARTTKDARQYDNVVATITEFLRQRVQIAQKVGVKRENIILDPGLGHFVSSNPHYSFEIIARLSELVGLRFPIFISPSRKSFVAGPENLPPADRLPGTIAASAIAVLNSATYIRTHDVAAVRRGCQIAAAILANNEPIP